MLVRNSVGACECAQEVRRGIKQMIKVDCPGSVRRYTSSLSTFEASLGEPIWLQKSFSPETCQVFAHTTLLTLLLGIFRNKYIFGGTLK